MQDITRQAAPCQPMIATVYIPLPNAAVLPLKTFPPFPLAVVPQPPIAYFPFYCHAISFVTFLLLHNFIYSLPVLLLPLFYPLYTTVALLHPSLLLSLFSAPNHHAVSLLRFSVVIYVATGHCILRLCIIPSRITAFGYDPTKTYASHTNTLTI